MLVRLLKENYIKNPNIFEDFRSNNIKNNIHYYSEDYFELDDDIEPFPIYLAIKDEATRNEKYYEAIEIFEKYYMELNRDIIFDQRFWHSIYLINFRDYIIKKYPSVLNDKSDFYNIILKKFDWENYIYKIAIATQYLNDHYSDSIDNRMKYYQIILDNLDLYNYLIKYRVFRNSIFIKNFLQIVEETDTSKTLKEKIKGREDLGDDERYGRRVLFEFNKIYPVLMFPMMDYSALKALFIKNLQKYLEV